MECIFYSGKLTQEFNEADLILYFRLWTHNTEKETQFNLILSMWNSKHTIVHYFTLDYIECDTMAELIKGVESNRDYLLFKMLGISKPEENALFESLIEHIRTNRPIVPAEVI